MRIVMKNYILLLLSIILIISASCTDQVNSHEQNKDLIIHANNELLNRGNMAYVDTVFAEGYRNNGTEVGREAVKNYVSTLLEAFPDLQVTVDPVLAEGNLVGWLRTHTGTHEGEFMGISPTGQKITWQSTNISRVDDGKITEEWGTVDLLQKLQAVETED